MGEQKLIQRLYVKDLFGFSQVKLEFDSGLVVLSGPSGAGKSVLMSAVLASLGIDNTEAALCELELEKPKQLRSEVYDLDDDLVVRSVKKERIRHYLGEQNVSKKALQSLFDPFVHFMSVRDKGGFESETFIALLDRLGMGRDTSHKKLLAEYKERYRSYREKKRELEVMHENERKMEELIEFTTFEINKIDKINPKVNEDEELLRIKKQLSRIDKVNDALAKAEAIFTLEEPVSELFRLLEKDGAYFSDMMNQLRADFEATESLAEELADTDVESVLNRLEQIAELKNRYGSIEEALEYKEEKERELSSYQRIEEDRGLLVSQISRKLGELIETAQEMSRVRREEGKGLEMRTSEYLARLKLPPVTFVFENRELDEMGSDTVRINLENTDTSHLSGGEHNRLRLALMAAALREGKKESGVVILDEIDANVSGDESIAIAEMIAKLASNYQIFAISHQPHLAAKAGQHILVAKANGESQATVLNEKGRIREIARIMSGESPDKEAIAFAKRLRKS